MSSMKLIAALILATALVVFGAQNTQSVTFHFLMFDVGPAPVLLAVFAAAIIGAMLAWTVSAPGRFRGMRRRRDLEHEVAAAQEQLKAATTALEESRRASRPPPTPPQGPS
ncbi:MAG: LapA family protein [Dehalococcoidia bacterium]|nr:MAG: LapA family protein [Dehalococcoidia bacterium]